MKALFVTFICMACLKETTEWILVDETGPFQFTHLCWNCYCFSEEEDEK